MIYNEDNSLEIGAHEMSTLKVHGEKKDEAQVKRLSLHVRRKPFFL